MEYDNKSFRGAVIEGYQVLLRAEASLLLPREKTQIAEFYTSLAEKCIQWATEVYGETVRKEFLGLSSDSDRARFSTRRYRFSMRYPWVGREYVAVLCESFLDGEKKRERGAYRRTSHVWSLSEELMLPIPQILKLFGMQGALRKISFRPDGVYPDGGELVMFKNPVKNTDFLENRREIGKIGKL